VYLRNRIRNNLIPELERSYNPKLKSTLCRMSYVLRTENDFMESCAKEVLSKWNIDPCNMCANIEIPAFVKLHPALRFRVAKKVLETYTLSKRETDYAHVRSIVDLAEGRRPNGSVNLPSGVVAKRDYDILTVSREENRFCECGSQGKDDKTKMNDYCYRVNVPGTVEIKEAGIKVRFEATGAEDVDFSLRNAVFIGRENISFPLFLRNIKPGDRIEPLGMKGTKKVSRFFIDRKISKGDRKKIPLLSDGRSILWIVGMQLSAVARVDHTTKEVIKAEII
jgi:tRNA(Ile)-lysidine synthase